MTLEEMEDKLDYYEGLLDYLDDVVPCLQEMIDYYNGEEGQ